MSQPIIDVAVAVIRHQDLFLLARRHKHQHQGDKLEFVGGKVETNETPYQALVREINEELGIDIGKQSNHQLGTIRHDYVDKSVRLWVYEVCLDDPTYQHYKSITQGQDGQSIYWHDKTTLLTLKDNFPKANMPIFDWLM